MYLYNVHDIIYFSFFKGIFMNKPEWYYTQSAVIPFQKNGDEIHIIVITSRNHKRWIVPKGIVEEALSPEDSAAKEALEEAGVKGQVYSNVIGEYQYEKWGGICTVQVFPLEVQEILENWEEMDRERKIVPLEEAKTLLTEKALSEMLDTLQIFVNDSMVQ